MGCVALSMQVSRLVSLAFMGLLYLFSRFLILGHSLFVRAIIQ